MDYNLNASTADSPIAAIDGDMPPVSVLGTRKGSFTKMANERQKLLNDVEEG